jgi:hypothetical protein
MAIFISLVLFIWMLWMLSEAFDREVERQRFSRIRSQQDALAEQHFHTHIHQHTQPVHEYTDGYRVRVMGRATEFTRVRRIKSS